MDKEKTKKFVNHIFRDMSGAMTAGLAFIGVRTGLFRAMDRQGPLSIEQVVERTDLHKRYVEEWLKGMSCAGYLIYDSTHSTFELPEEHAYLLASDGSDHFAGGMFSMAPTLLSVAPKVAEAFEHGGGVAFDDFGEEGMLALDLINQGNYRHKLVDYWLPTMPDVVSRLEQGSRVLDIGCGSGEACLVMAKAFPDSTFVGLDLHTESIERARQSAEGFEKGPRVQFLNQRIEDLEDDEQFDLITAFDCVHDFTDPIAVLVEIRKRLKPNGTFFVVEPKAADRLEDNQNDIGTMFYGFSVFHCMTQSLAHDGAGLGTCMGPEKTGALMLEAGFDRCVPLDIKSQVNLFYAVTK